MNHPTRRMTLQWLAGLGLAAAHPAALGATSNPALLAALILKIFSHDRSLRLEDRPPLVIGVIMNPDITASAFMAGKMTTLLNDLGTENEVTVHGRKVSAELLGCVGGVVPAIEPGAISALVVEPHLDEQIVQIGALIRRLSLPAICPRRDWIDEELPIALLGRSTPPEIIINLDIARELGMKLDPRLLKLAELVSLPLVEHP